MIGYEGRNKHTVNYLRTIYFNRPEWTPCRVGLMLYAECEPDVSLENIDVICAALEKVCNPPEL